MKAGLGAYIILCIVVSIKICHAIQCNTAGDSLFSKRVRATSPADCLRCISFTHERQELLKYVCQGANQQNFFYDIYRQYDCQALTITKGYFSETAVNLESTKQDWTWRNLEFLDISKNMINNIEPNCFNHFTNLIVLDLNNNNITSIGNTELSQLNKLQILNLSRNSIATVGSDSFKSLTDLFEVDLSYNKITYIPKQLFKYQGFLEIVSIHNNEIVKFECILKHIVANSALSFDLSSNKIETLELQGDFKELNINNNLLNEFSLNLSSSLESLDLSNNKLIKIGEFVMLEATHLKKLNLSTNFLESIPTSSFRKQKFLESLDISNNLLSKSHYDFEDNWVSFFLNFEHLKNVYLDKNMWTCTDLKDILHILKSRSVNVVEGNEHIKSNILGIACAKVNLNNTRNLTESVAEFDPHIIVNRVLNEVLKHIVNNTALEQKIVNISSRINNLENNNVADITKSSDKHEIEAKILDIYSKIRSQELRINKIDIKKNNFNLKDENTSQLEPRLIDRINLLFDSKFSNLSEDYQLQKTENELSDTGKLLQQPCISTNNGISGQIIQNLLLFSVLSVLCILLYYISIKRNKSRSREVMNLVEA